MLDKYVYGANAILLIYDVTSLRSFEVSMSRYWSEEHLWLLLFLFWKNLETWLRASQRVTSTMERPPIYALVANKIDQEHLRTVKSDRHHKFAQVWMCHLKINLEYCDFKSKYSLLQENGLLTYAVSAKTSEGVALCFQKVAAELVGIR